MWDVNLCMTWPEKILVPFKYFGNPKLWEPSTTSASFPSFLDLPVEIQFRIYECCDASTLFQLMHTCAHSRSEASKLFWAHQDIWYYCQDAYKFTYQYLHPILQFCPEFASRIAQIEFELGRLELVFQADNETPHARQQMNTVEKAQSFWSRVQQTFPSIKKVVLTGLLSRMGALPPDDEYDVAYSALTLVVQQAPPNIIVFLAVEDNRSGIRLPQKPHRLWRVAADLRPSWQIVEEDWTPSRILLPPKRFSTYPLGTFLTFLSNQEQSVLESRGLRWLRVESYARYAVGSTITCPKSDCDSTFTEKDTWRQHLKDTHHNGYGSGQEDETKSRFCEHTPAEFKTAIEKRQNRVSASYEDARAIWRKLHDGWDQEGTEKRRMFEEAFRAQLREANAFSPGELVEDTCPWFDTFNMYFDSTHVYYSGISDVSSPNVADV
ncbi:hypothetical protein P153DRAFT_435860 [Dothidotthia symphoricarpi CBS 119687]|uniref:C2H2-type domain-containing protein n=1 Tax=Dothidotthia symphoricarpi CBS 119687 TaxID=1392245 RepID=A0A6A5ZYR4_9PLEO|nr:uncharacterized protein P153DRAFT_435860 [Dothidotthia symphoricarpi CBS 119687]KAF2123528.1 hypothetical protein P153DRAFT_435860 [Dothidotthia symphoricarpi CBS 119687]